MRYALLDSCDPVRAATLFYGDAATLWLDSADTDHPSSRWSYLCIAPIATLQVRAEELSRGEDGFADRADEVRAWIRSTERQRIAEGPRSKAARRAMFPMTLRHSSLSDSSRDTCRALI